MRASVYHGPRDIRVEDVPDATLRSPTDALVRVTHACICGSDLWPYRGELEIYGRPGRTGHEFMGVVEAVGRGRAHDPARPARDRALRLLGRHLRLLRAGPPDLVPHGGYWGGTDDGGQGEAVRAPLADGTLVPLPDEVDLSDDRLAAALATLTDVMGTGHHGALSRGRRARRHRRRGRRRRGRPLRRARRRRGSAPSGSSSSATTTTAWRSPAASAPPTSSPSAATRPSRGCAR